MVKKIVARTQNDGWKPKKKRKPMTEEQRKAYLQKDSQSQGQRKLLVRILLYTQRFLHYQMNITCLQRKSKSG